MAGDNFELAKEKLKTYADDLGLSQDTVNTGYHLLDDFQKKNQEFDAEDMAAGAVYFSSILVGERKTQKEVGKAANIIFCPSC